MREDKRKKRSTNKQMFATWWGGGGKFVAALARAVNSGWGSWLLYQVTLAYCIFSRLACWFSATSYVLLRVAESWVGPISHSGSHPDQSSHVTLRQIGDHPKIYKFLHRSQNRVVGVNKPKIPPFSRLGHTGEGVSFSMFQDIRGSSLGAIS